MNEQLLRNTIQRWNPSKTIRENAAALNISYSHAWNTAKENNLSYKKLNFVTGKSFLNKVYETNQTKKESLESIFTWDEPLECGGLI